MTSRAKNEAREESRRNEVRTETSLHSPSSSPRARDLPSVHRLARRVMGFPLADVLASEDSGVVEEFQCKICQDLVEYT